MMSKKIVYIIIIVIGCVSFSFAQSENDIRNPVSIGAQIGWQKATDADDGMVMFGGLLRAKLTYAVSLEASINYRQENYHDGDIKVSNWPVQVSGLFFPIQHLYGLMGVGWYNAKLEFSGRLNGLPDKTSQKFGWHFGAGVEVPLGERTFLFGDFRYVFLNYDFTDVPGGGEISSDYLQINAGLMFPL